MYFGFQRTINTENELRKNLSPHNLEVRPYLSVILVGNLPVSA